VLFVVAFLFLFLCNNENLLVILTNVLLLFFLYIHLHLCSLFLALDELDAHFLSVVNTLNTFQYDEMCRINSEHPPTIIGS